jgi:hypothetical protein
VKLVDLSSLPITPSETARFWSRVDRSAGPAACWPWTGLLYRTGYGRFWICRSNLVIPILPHRLAFFLVTGTDPGTDLVCHTCDNRRCANPGHLWIGSNSQNILDAIAKGRKRPSGGVLPGERNGFAKVTPAAVLAIRFRYGVGGVAARALGEEYGVTKSQALRIIHRKSWRHLDPESQAAP